MSLRLLLIEDSEDDALLLVRELRREGFELECSRIDTPQELESNLDATVIGHRYRAGNTLKKDIYMTDIVTNPVTQ